MADEPETTPIHNKYAQQYAADLEANRKEQADVKEHLEQLRVDEAWLIQAMGSLPTAAPPGAPEVAPAAESETPTPAEAVAADALQSVPQPRQDKDKPVKAAQSKQPAKKTTAKKAAAKKTTTGKTTAKKAPAKTATPAEVPAETPAPKEKAGPPLHELILAILLKTPGEPRVAREVTDQLANDHPTRATSVQTVRNNLETLVKRNLVETSRQGKTRMYTAFADTQATSATDDAAGGEAEEAPETAADKVPAEV